MLMRRLACLCSLGTLAALPASSVGAFETDPLFASDEILKVTITAPLSTINRERSDSEYLDGKFAFTGADGQPVEFDMRVRARGKFRRRPEVCQFVPLRLNFKKSETKDTLLDKQDKLKLVTHCQNGSPNYQQSVVAEYVAYRIVNLLTDVSFRARLLQVTYIDTDQDNREKERYAILLEHKDRLAKRIDASPRAIHMIAVPDLVPEYGALGALIQYFLGNTDFSQLAGSPNEDCCHNHALFIRDDKHYYSVPYDFDMTGFVNAPHAAPNTRLKLRNVRERLYRGRCMLNEQIPGAIALFEQKREAIYELINSFDHLDRSTRRAQIRFVDDFYGSIESPKKIQRNLYDKCL